MYIWSIPLIVVLLATLLAARLKTSNFFTNLQYHNNTIQVVLRHTVINFSRLTYMLISGFSILYGLTWLAGGGPTATTDLSDIETLLAFMGLTAIWGVSVRYASKLFIPETDIVALDKLAATVTGPLEPILRLSDEIAELASLLGIVFALPDYQSDVSDALAQINKSSVQESGYHRTIRQACSRLEQDKANLETSLSLSDAFEAQWRAALTHVSNASPSLVHSLDECYERWMQAKDIYLPQRQWDLYTEVMEYLIEEVNKLGDLIRGGSQQATDDTVSGANVEEAHEFLGTRPSDNWTTVQKRYKQKAKEVHPDLAGGDDESMKRLNLFMEILRQHYQQ